MIFCIEVVGCNNDCSAKTSRILGPMQGKMNIEMQGTCIIQLDLFQHDQRPVRCCRPNALDL